MTSWYHAIYYFFLEKGVTIAENTLIKKAKTIFSSKSRNHKNFLVMKNYVNVFIIFFFRHQLLKISWESSVVTAALQIKIFGAMLVHADGMEASAWVLVISATDMIVSVLWFENNTLAVTKIFLLLTMSMRTYLMNECH